MVWLKNHESVDLVPKKGNMQEKPRGYYLLSQDAVTDNVQDDLSCEGFCRRWLGPCPNPGIVQIEGLLRLW